MCFISPKRDEGWLVGSMGYDKARWIFTTELGVVSFEVGWGKVMESGCWMEQSWSKRRFMGVMVCSDKHSVRYAYHTQRKLYARNLSHIEKRIFWLPLQPT